MAIPRASHEIALLASSILDGMDDGKKSELARQAGISRQAVNSWRMLGIPIHRAKLVAEFCGLTLADVRPDVFDPPKPDGD